MCLTYSLCFADDTTRLTNEEPSRRYQAENELESVPISLPPVSAEQLFPAGKILQIDEKTSCRSEFNQFMGAL